MTQHNLNIFKQLIYRYICAKDLNRPHLLQQVFCNDAILDMKVESENITFPSQTNGLADISQVLVRNFSQTYENIYTYCLEDTIDYTTDSLVCQWLVIMSDKETGQLKVGTGDYLWAFSPLDRVSNSSIKVQQLSIKIQHMLVLDKSLSSDVLGISEKLAYPWCSKSQILAELEGIVALQDINDAIKR